MAPLPAPCFHQKLTLETGEDLRDWGPGAGCMQSGIASQVGIKLLLCMLSPFQTMSGVRCTEILHHLSFLKHSRKGQRSGKLVSFSDAPGEGRPGEEGGVGGVGQRALSSHASDDCPGGDQGSIPPLTQQIPGDRETGK